MVGTPVGSDELGQYYAVSVVNGDVADFLARLSTRMLDVGAVELIATRRGLVLVSVEEWIRYPDRPCLDTPIIIICWLVTLCTCTVLSKLH